MKGGRRERISVVFFFSDTATTEIYTSLFVGSVSVYKRQLFDAGYDIIDLYGKLVDANNSEPIANGDYLACINGAETAKKLGSSPFELI